MPTNSIGKNSGLFCAKTSDSHVFQTGLNCLPDGTEIADVHLIPTFFSISSIEQFALETASSDELLNLSSSLGSFSKSETALAF